ncbi:MAG: hypothetical protein APR63_00460 [Desulfuromonas sp. SDB]|nr:MAG: hypothetical protein APR63_00460 [Desulfuromonas sp. SDB]
MVDNSQLEISPLSWLEKQVATMLEFINVESSNIKIEQLAQDEYQVLIDAGKDDGLLIGRDGATLDAIAHILGKMMAAHYQGYRINVDVAGYRQRKEDRLRSKVLEIADKVNELTSEYIIKGLTPQERRIVHLTIQDFDHLESRSEGEGILRDVVIYSKN